MRREQAAYGHRPLAAGASCDEVGAASCSFSFLRKKRHLGYDVIGFISEREGPIDALPVIARIEGVRAAVIANDAAAVFIAGSDLSADAPSESLGALGAATSE